MTLTANALYIPAVFHPFIMIDVPFWKLIALHGQLNF